MKEIFLKNNIVLDDEKLSKFERYYNLLIEYNKAFNITTITEKEDVYIKHFVDSVINVDKLKSGKLIDVGSGGGFPAIPIKIVREDIDVTMVEATNKKCIFLNAVINELNLKNIQVINGRAEELAKKEEFREKFDICSARAVARLNVLCEYCMPFIKVGGEFVAYKGIVEEEVLEANNAINILGGKLKSVDKYLLNGDNRAMVYVQKIAKTDKKYPRGQGRERKNPL